MGCEGCEGAGRARSRIWDSVIEKAADYAKKNNSWVGIYQTPEGFDFIELSQAAGLPILDRISPNYRPAS